MAKTRNMSVALESDFQDKLKKLAHTKGISVSFLIRETLEKYLFANKDTVKLVLHVPKDLTNKIKKINTIDIVLILSFYFFIFYNYFRFKIIQNKL